VGDKCRLEVYGPDEDGTRIICNSTDDCPLEHPGVIGLDCFGAGSAGRTDAVAGLVATTTQEVRPEGGSPPVETSGHAPGTLKVEPGAGKTEMATVQEGLNVAYVGGKPGPVPDSHIKSFSVPHINKIISHDLDRGKFQDNASVSQKTFSENLSPTDSHMVVPTFPSLFEPETYNALVSSWKDALAKHQDEEREQAVQKYVDKLNEISFEMYLESKSSGPPPIPILGPEESRQFLKNLEEFKLTPEQQEFYRDAARKFSSLSHWEPEVYDAMMRRQDRRLKRRKRYTVSRSGGMIRMPGNKPEPPEPEEESLFEVDDEMYGPILPKVKAEPELQKPVPKAEKPDEVDKEEDEEEAHGDLGPVQDVQEDDEEDDESPEQVIEGFETSGDTSLGGYFLGLEVWTDVDGDHTVTLTIDAMSYDIMLPDFMEMLGALNKVKGRLQQILNT